MMKKFTEDSISGKTQLKSSAQRSIRAKLLEQMPLLEPYIEDLLPKKEKWALVKCVDHVSVIATPNGDPLFVQYRDGPFCPCLRLLHKYPFLLDTVQVDRGAIKHVMRGADVMCPGLTSAGAKMETGFIKDKVVAIKAEGKEVILAIGLALMTSDDIRSVNNGVGLQNVHYVNDGLWNMPVLRGV